MKALEGIAFIAAAWGLYGLLVYEVVLGDLDRDERERRWLRQELDRIHADRLPAAVTYAMTPPEGHAANCGPARGYRVCYCEGDCCRDHDGHCNCQDCRAWHPDGGGDE